MFGIYKKLKEGFKKLKPWLQKTLPKVKEAINNVTPIVKTITQEVPKYTKNEKVKNILDLTNSGIDVINNAVNRNYEDEDDNEPHGILQTINEVNDWRNFELKPRLKRKSMNLD